MRFDDILQYAGQFGRYQRRVYACLCLPAISVAFQSLSSVFLLAVPAHRCRLPGLVNDTYRGQGDAHMDAINTSIPHGDDNALSECHIYNNNESQACDSWVYDKSQFSSTLATELDLVCQWRLGGSHVQMLFMCGSLLGCLLLGPPADFFGRKIVLMICLLVHLIAALGLAFTASFVYLCIFSFLNGFATNVMYSLLFVMAMELVGPGKRATASFVICIVYALGVCLLAGLAYLLRLWQHLQLATSSGIGLFLVYYWILPESPRWLVSRGRYEAGNAILRAMARTNGRKIPPQALTWQGRVDTGEVDRRVPLWKLVTYPRLLIRTLILYLNWMVCSMTFYGLGLNVGSLAGSIYLNFVLYGCVEIVAYLLCWCLTDRIGRKTLHLSCMFVAGVACMASPFPLVFGGQDLQWLSNTCAILGKFGVSGAFATIWMYSGELFPTVVRNSGISSSSVCARIGGVIAPYIANLAVVVDGEVGQLLPLIIFGSLSLIAGVSSLYLPETRGQQLPENLEDANSFGRQRESPHCELEMLNKSPTENPESHILS